MRLAANGHKSFQGSIVLGMGFTFDDTTDADDVTAGTPSPLATMHTLATNTTNCDRILPYIGGEEDKVETEPCKILGDLVDGSIRPLEAVVSAQCNRVQVVDGHTVCVSIELAEKPSLEAVKEAFRSYRGVPQERNLPTAPERPVVYFEENNRPQPRRDALTGNGMTVSVGRLRECPLLGYKFVALGHNTIRGAAGAAVLNAELMHSEGLLE
jgi:aspartate-semialdehyde dehydrogenase